MRVSVNLIQHIAYCLAECRDNLVTCLRVGTARHQAKGKSHTMRGVIIWYSRQDFSAVIWCEDSKDLGIATGPTAWRNPMAEVEIGDFVAFRVSDVGFERHCKDIHLLEARQAPALPHSILKPTPLIPVKTRIPLLHLCASRD